MLIVTGSGSGKRNALLTLINHETDMNKFFDILKIDMKENITCFVTKMKVRA